MKSKPFEGKTAVVTGSSKGIGRAIALRLAQGGANVIVHGRTESNELSSVQSEIVKLGVEVHSILGDFSNLKSWDDFVGQAWRWKENVDIWINNAGGDVLTGEWPDRELEDKLQFLLQVDVTASLMLSKSAGDRMKASANSDAPGKRSIVNIGWDQAWQGMAGVSGELFATTKGAIMAMTRSLAQSYAPEVRVNCIAPGWIKTQWGESASDYWDNRAKAESLMNRWGTPEDVAGVASFLCSDSASFVSGQIIPVNGGFDSSQENENKNLSD